MIEFSAVTDFGQINQGELLVIEKKNGLKFVAVAKKVLDKGRADEEVIICIKGNQYFITSMLLDGSSWVKNVTRLPSVNVTTITNTSKNLNDI